jgi:hypothetical protein
LPLELQSAGRKIYSLLHFVLTVFKAGEALPADSSTLLPPGFPPLLQRQSLLCIGGARLLNAGAGIACTTFDQKVTPLLLRFGNVTDLSVWEDRTSASTSMSHVVLLLWPPPMSVLTTPNIGRLALALHSIPAGLDDGLDVVAA